MKEKIPVGVLGATGVVGQRFVHLLADHPWFEVKSLIGSERTAGKTYQEACSWRIPGTLPPSLGHLVLQPLNAHPPVRLLFSALPSDIAREWEPRFAKAGMVVCSNASAFRTDPLVPLVIPEVNASHIDLIPRQQQTYGWKGFIITSPNCTTTAAVMPLKPLHHAFGVEKVFITSLQALSGAGYPGISALDVQDNIIPYIAGEEEKMEEETRILLNDFNPQEQGSHPSIQVSAQANRVPVIDGHTVCLSIQFRRKPGIEEARQALINYQPEAVIQTLPSAPSTFLILRDEEDRPQPRRDRDAANGMAAVVGRVRSCPILHLRMVSVIHNAIRGAAGGALLNAELLAAKGYLQ